VEDALKIYLRLIVQKSDDEQIRKLLSETLKSADALRFLNEHLAPSASTASALAFLASTVKVSTGPWHQPIAPAHRTVPKSACVHDVFRRGWPSGCDVPDPSPLTSHLPTSHLGRQDFSGIKEAITLYGQCIEHVPSSASYALNLMHLHELHLDYAQALAALCAHCEANPTTSVGTLSLAELLAALPTPDELTADMWRPPTAEALAAHAVAPPERTLLGLPEETGADALDPSTLKPYARAPVGTR
jgi:hypothetical protein